MKKKSKNNIDVAQTLAQIQEQLASLDKKLETFINKSLTDIAQALAAQKTAVAPRHLPAPSAPFRPQEQQNRRPMFAVVCFECGKDTQIPFKPAPGRSVYCPACFAKRRTANISAKANPEVKSVAPTAVKAPEPAPKQKKKSSAAKKKPAAKKKK